MDYISIDWGTSNLRLHQVDAVNLTVSNSVQVNSGVKSVYDLWSKSDESRIIFYLQVLQDLFILHGFMQSKDMPILISGMASSSIGIQELPYAMLPFSLRGHGLTVKELQQHQFTNPIYLISGVAADEDVMRGEETQLIGLSDDLPSVEKSIVILPGTHSKHINIRDGKVVDFQTYITGELFQILQEHSILKDSLTVPATSSPDVTFDQGVKDGVAGAITQCLFRIRARHLLKQTPRNKNYFYLSGLMMGHELGMLKKYPNHDIFLGASGTLGLLYQRALEVLDLPFVKIDEENLENAVIRAHKYLIENL